MNIHEYQAKELLAQYGVNILRGIIALNESELDSLLQNFNADKYVVKAQIYAGARGKGGGIKIARDKMEAAQFAKAMFGKFLVTPQTTKRGLLVSRVYIEEAFQDVDKQYYLSVIIDKKSSMILFIASESGGINIEDVASSKPDQIKKLRVCPFWGLHNFNIVNFALSLNIKTAKSIRSFTNLIKSLYKIFVDYDATQIEINPLCINSSEDFIALDAKITFDENALFKHESLKNLIDLDQYDPLEIRSSKTGLSYIKMEGNIGCMVNGAGLAMATMDIIKLYGGSPANFLDVGGGADVVKVTEAFKIIIADKSVKAILVNIFGGIMKCDIIAEGVIMAVKDAKADVPIIIRLEGTNVDLGRKKLFDSDIDFQVVETLPEAARIAVEKST